MSWILERCICVTIIGVIFFNACFIKRVIGTWLNPACLFSMFWLVMIALPLCVAYRAPINPLGVGFIAVSLITFSLSSLMFNWRRAFLRNESKKSAKEIYCNKYMKVLVYASSLIAALAVILHAIAQGFSVGDLFRNTLKVASTYASNRYSGDVSGTFFSRLGLLLGYVAVICGGLYFGSIEGARGRLRIVLVCFLPSALMMVLQSSKGALFLSGAFFFGGILVSRVFSKTYYVAKKRDVFTAVKAIIVIVPLATLSFLARGLYRSSDASYVIERIRAYFVSYSSGHLFAFSDWFSSYIGYSSLINYQNPSQGYGFYSLMCFFRWAGDLRDVPMGIYDDFYHYGAYLQSNIYTAFRGSVTDFGVLGSLLFTFILGAIIHSAYYFMLSSRRPWLSVAIFILAVGGIYMSYIISIFTWNVIPVAIICVAITLLVNNVLHPSNTYRDNEIDGGNV